MIDPNRLNTEINQTSFEKPMTLPIHQHNGDSLMQESPAPEKLSILMPVFNERWTVAEIIRRVLDAPLSLERELVVVDDASTDGSYDVLRQLAADHPQIRLFQHEVNRGKGSAIRTAISHMTGDVAVVQDADLEYDPRDLQSLLQPIIDGQADAVYGSRYAGENRRVHPFWHTLVNQTLTLMSNMINDLSLTDMETCYKMIRADVLRCLKLSSHTFTLEPEITCRLSQWGARIHEVPVSYVGRTFGEGKKIRPIDGVKAIWQMVYSKFIDRQFTTHQGMLEQFRLDRSPSLGRSISSMIAPYLGNRVLETGAGIGSLSRFLLNREQLIVADQEDLYVEKLRQRLQGQPNTRVDHMDLTRPEQFEGWKNDALDTVICSNILEEAKVDPQLLQSFRETLIPGGHCVVLAAGAIRNGSVTDDVPFETVPEVELKMSQAGLDVVFVKLVKRRGLRHGHLIVIVGQRPEESTMRAAA